MITSSTEGSQTLTIAFTAPIFNGGLAITSYEYAVRPSSGVWTAWETASFESTPLQSPIVISGLVNGTSYTVAIRAVNGLGPSASSNQLSTSTTPRTVPNAPFISSINPGNGFLSVNFNPPAFNGGSAITNYQFSINDGSTWTTRSPISTASPITIGGLTNGTNYSIVIRALNAAGEGASSNSITQKPFTTPTAPQSVSVTNGGGGASAPSVSISFSTPASNGGDTITNYQYSLNGGSTWITRSPASTASPIVISGLSNSVVYNVGLRAVNSAGGGASSGFTSIRPLPHFTSASASTPAVADYPYISTQSDTYRTVNWSADLDNNFSAGTWRVRLLDGVTVIATSVNYTTTNATNGSFTISYANSAYWKNNITVSFEITDSSSQTTSTSTTVNIPAAESTTTTIWSTVNDTYNGSIGTTGLQSTNHNKPAGSVVPSAIYTTGRAFDNDNDTQFRVDKLADTNAATRHVETFANFIVPENTLGTLVTSTATTAGPIINSSSMTITEVRFRSGIRNTSYFLVYDLYSNSFKGTPGASSPPSGAYLAGQPTVWNIESTSVVQDGTTWNSSGAVTIALERGATTSNNPNYWFNMSVVQRRGSTGTTEPSGRIILTDAQYDFVISYQRRQSSTGTLYR